MALYCYIKEKKTLSRILIKKTSYIFLIVGSGLLFWALYPIFAFEIYDKLIFSKNFKSALVNSRLDNVLSSQTMNTNNLRDFTQVRLWFPGKGHNQILKNLPINNYQLSIPKLNIDSAKVIVGGEDLNQGLVHYYPRSQPGEVGNIVILGHSTLPQLYNPKDYKTIFTYLSSLEKGDIITLHYNGVDYQYKADEIFIVKPEETWVLDDTNDQSILTLITCVPPGTYWKRLIVRARLEQLPQ